MVPIVDWSGRLFEPLLHIKEMIICTFFIEKYFYYGMVESMVIQVNYDLTLYTLYYYSYRTTKCSA